MQKLGFFFSLATAIGAPREQETFCLANHHNTRPPPVPYFAAGNIIRDYFTGGRACSS